MEDRVYKLSNTFVDVGNQDNYSMEGRSFYLHIGKVQGFGQVKALVAEFPHRLTPEEEQECIEVGCTATYISLTLT